MFRKLLERLKHKYGPLPLWAWTAIAGAGVYLWNRTRGGPSEQEAAAPAFAPAYAFGEGGGEPDYGDTGPGAVGEVGAVEGGGSEAYPDNKLRMEAMELIDQIRGIQDELGATTYAPEFAGGEEVVEPDQADSIATPGKAPQPEVGVRWGGRVFKSKAALGKWLAEHGAGAGQAARAYKTWAQRHPGAAAKLSGPAPKPPKKKAAKAPAKASARQPGRAPAKGGRGAGGARARAPQRPPAKAQRPRPTPQPRRAPAPAPKPKPKPKRTAKVVARLRRRRT